MCLKWLQEECRVLCIGAGGLGCELLKDLALVGFRNIDVIDMDTIDYSNLNRQFLFRVSDVGKSKSVAAAAFINKRVAGAKVIAHHSRIEAFDDTFYRSFHVVVSGLDSVNARRWLNSKLVGLSALTNDDSGWDPVTCVPCINGGTEGWKGETRVIQAHFTPCFECLVDLFPKEPFNFPMCTYAHTPRQPEHCIVFAMEKAWPEAFGEKKWDGDNETDITWLMDSAIEHANKFGIQGVTYKLTQGVVKRIIPAIASTNAVISASCANEAFKMLTFCHDRLDNFMNYSGNGGCNTNVVSNELNAQCLVCGCEPLDVTFDKDSTLKDFIQHLIDDDSTFKFFTNPSLSWPEEEEQERDSMLLYVPPGTFLHKQIAGNIEKTLVELLGDHGAVVLLKEHGSHKLNRLNIHWAEKAEQQQ
jgi:ubiquitin-activating enzyme E1 C